MWSSLRRRALNDEATWPQRTEDYQQPGYENHPTGDYSVSELKPLRSVHFVRLRSLGLGVGQGTSGMCAEFSVVRAFAEAEPQSHPTTLVSEKPSVR